MKHYPVALSHEFELNVHLSAFKVHITVDFNEPLKHKNSLSCYVNYYLLMLVKRRRKNVVLDGGLVQKLRRNNANELS